MWHTGTGKDVTTTLAEAMKSMQGKGNHGRHFTTRSKFRSALGMVSLTLILYLTPTSVVHVCPGRPFSGTPRVKGLQGDEIIRKRTCNHVLCMH